MLLLVPSLATQGFVSLLYINLSKFLCNQIIATDVLFTVNS